LFNASWVVEEIHPLNLRGERWKTLSTISGLVLAKYPISRNVKPFIRVTEFEPTPWHGHNVTAFKERCKIFQYFLNTLLVRELFVTKELCRHINRLRRFAWRMPILNLKKLIHLVLSRHCNGATRNLASIELVTQNPPASFYKPLRRETMVFRKTIFHVAIFREPTKPGLKPDTRVRIK
jgi:hypothetical protein